MRKYGDNSNMNPSKDSFSFLFVSKSLINLWKFLLASSKRNEYSSNLGSSWMSSLKAFSPETKLEII